MNMRALTGTDDLPRRTFTVKEVERMGEVGLIREDERIELIGGELVPMNAKGSRHETLKRQILRRWYKLAPAEIDLIPETTFRLSEDTFVEPDVLIFPQPLQIGQLSAANVLLAVEISDSSLGYDLGPKALVYAHFGLRELWVIDAIEKKIYVHRDPVEGRYRSITPWASGDLVLPAFAPSEFRLRLDDFDLGE
jgi:Uma2 family endonuclease